MRIPFKVRPAGLEQQNTIALREDHGWRWEIEDPYRRYNEARIRLRLHSAIQRPGEHAGENNRYEIELRGVQPRS